MSVYAGLTIDSDSSISPGFSDLSFESDDHEV